MKIFNGQQIEDGFLDVYLNKNEVRIQVGDTWVLKEISDQYIVPKRSLRLVFNYIKKVGVVQVARKITSRLKEQTRNHKYVIFGKGKVIDTQSTNYSVGSEVYFIGYNHPLWADNVAINEGFVMLAEGAAPFSKTINIHEFNEPADPSLLHPVSAWSPFSGLRVPEQQLASLFQYCLKQLNNSKLLHNFEVEAGELSIRTSQNTKSTLPEYSAILFGYGQYAKTMILPNLDARTKLQEICEIDPMQLGKVKDEQYIYSTNPFTSNNNYMIWIVAGYHHTHAPIAVHALSQGSYVIMEKPVVTTIEQYRALEPYLDSGRIFVGFHKRYFSYNQYIHQDLQVTKGMPISYFCVIYEIDLPEKHWYNWPNSQSRLVSNGCHWIDHFMFLNDYSEVVKYDLIVSDSGDYLVSAELENGAVFHMTLTDKGSSRLGVRENIELRSAQHHIRITDFTYIAEDVDRVTRKLKFNPYGAYSLMYRQMSEKIINQEKGDSVASFRSSWLMLQLEELYKQKKKIHTATPSPA